MDKPLIAGTNIWPGEPVYADENGMVVGIGPRPTDEQIEAVRLAWERRYTGFKANKRGTQYADGGGAYLPQFMTRAILRQYMPWYRRWWDTVLELFRSDP